MTPVNVTTPVEVALAMVITSDDGCEALEATTGDRHQFGDPSQIPVGVGHLGVANIGREGGHGVADIGAVLMPKLDAAADEGVAQIMNARLGVGTTRRPPEFASQSLEHPMDGPRNQLRPACHFFEEARFFDPLLTASSNKPTSKGLPRKGAFLRGSGICAAE